MSHACLAGEMFLAAVSFIEVNYGKKVWKKVAHQLKLPKQIEASQQYPFSTFMDVVNTTSNFLRMSKKNFLEQVGQHWVPYTASKPELEPMLRTLGKNFPKALASVNSLHVTVSRSGIYPGLSPPQLEVLNDKTPGKIQCLYTPGNAARCGVFHYIIIGAIKGFAKYVADIDNCSVTIVEEQPRPDSDLVSYVLEIVYEVPESENQSQLENEDPESEPVDPCEEDRFPFQLEGDNIARLFPFFFTSDSTDNCVHIGPSILKMCPELMLSKLDEIVTVIFPNSSAGRFSYKKLSLLTRELCILAVKGIEFRGQLILQDGLLHFFGNPCFKNLDSLLQSDLSINDFAFHDTAVGLAFSSITNEMEARKQAKSQKLRLIKKRKSKKITRRSPAFSDTKSPSPTTTVFPTQRSVSIDDLHFKSGKLSQFSPRKPHSSHDPQDQHPSSLQQQKQDKQQQQQQQQKQDKQQQQKQDKQQQQQQQKQDKQQQQKQDKQQDLHHRHYQQEKEERRSSLTLGSLFKGSKGTNLSSSPSNLGSCQVAASNSPKSPLSFDCSEQISPHFDRAYRSQNHADQIRKAITDLFLSDGPNYLLTKHFLTSVRKNHNLHSERICSALIIIFEQHGKAVELLESITFLEIQDEIEEETFFRQDSVATSLSFAFLNKYSEKFMTFVLSSLEEASSSSSSSSSFSPRTSQKDIFSSYLSILQLGIETKLDSEACYFLLSLYEYTKQKKTEKLASLLVTNFFFLRFLHPRLLTASHKNIKVVKKLQQECQPSLPWMDVFLLCCQKRLQGPPSIPSPFGYFSSIQSINTLKEGLSKTLPELLENPTTIPLLGKFVSSSLDQLFFFSSSFSSSTSPSSLPPPASPASSASPASLIVPTSPP